MRFPRAMFQTFTTTTITTQLPMKTNRRLFVELGTVDNGIKINRVSEKTISSTTALHESQQQQQQQQQTMEMDFPCRHPVSRIEISGVFCLKINSHSVLTNGETMRRFLNEQNTNGTVSAKHNEIQRRSV